MTSKSNQLALDKPRSSIGSKLALIISLIIIISLGSFTALGYWLAGNNLRTKAAERNLEINLRAAMSAETTLANIRSGSRMITQTINDLRPQGSALQRLTDSFFIENDRIIAVFVPGRTGMTLVNRNSPSSRSIDKKLINSSFKSLRNILVDAAPVDKRLIDSFFNSERDASVRLRQGEIALKNASSHFGSPVLALYFPLQNGEAGITLFSSEGLSSNSGLGANRSFMVNREGEILVHYNFDLLQNKTKIDMDIVNSILNSSELSKQQLVEINFGAAQSSYIANQKILLYRDKIYSTAKPVIDNVFMFLANFGFGEAKPAVKPDEAKKVSQFVAYTRLPNAPAIVITAIERDRVFEDITSALWRNICFSIIVLIISIVFIRLFARTISVPLRSLVSATQKIEDGVFDVELKSKSRDEIGRLTANFKKMGCALNTFGKFSNREVAAKSLSGEIKPDGVSKHCTVFFSDIREFSARAETFNKFFGFEASEKIVCWLNNYFTQIIDCVEKTDGVVDKFIGSAVMAHWGAVYSAGSPRKDAFNCVKAALMLRKELYFLNRSRKPGDPANPPIRIGCGINSGMVTAGQFGSNKRAEYTVIGDNVNFAEQIKALTSQLGADILISEDTWKLVGDKFITEEMHAVTVPGRTKPARIFAVVNFEGDPKGPQSLDEVRSLLGIEAEDLESL
ncbi:MAG: adenylate/guanylate cyclase domain-containing protein [Treponema sp.]|jgi:adenylate cyclase|nr:adenylate/guanylate cyclase domain-containing protein [Treponema sp.]